MAHDYNNILNVIIGYTEMALEIVAMDDPLQEDVEEIYMAAGRSRDITRQLLAFARQETISSEMNGRELSEKNKPCARKPNVSICPGMRRTSSPVEACWAKITSFCKSRLLLVIWPWLSGRP